jgi:hypothetical protein
MSERQQQRRARRRRKHSERSTTRRLVTAGGLTAGATIAMSGVAHAAPTTFTVGSTADTAGAADCTTATNSDCTLRQAITDANANSGADTIVFKSGVTGTITMVNDPVTVTEALIVQGPGSAALTVDGDGKYRTFSVDPGTAYDPVTISGLTLTNGYTTGNGAAIYNNTADLTISNAVVSNGDAYGPSVGGGAVYSASGNLTINSSTISGNYVGSPTDPGRGGGVYLNTGDLAVTNSTFSGNTAANYSDAYYGAYGGGINANAGDITIDRSTITGNKARDGGGVYSNSGDLTVTNSTITGNSAVSDDGGGVYVGNGALRVIGSTVTDNYAATYGGGLRASGGDNTLKNTIVSGNTANEEPDMADLGQDGEVFDVAFSLIGVRADHVNTTVPGSNLFAVNPQLGSLQNNGGPTETMEPLAASPVIDCGSDTASAFDQRGAGFPRVVDQPNRTKSTATGANNADMGAVEVAASASIAGACTNNAPAPPPPPVTPTNPAPTPNPTHKKKCKKKKHKRSADSAKKKKCKKKKKK